jgi:hydroxyacylglutathione hydrolase
MALEIIPYALGPLANNSYLLVDNQTRQAVIVDPSFESHVIASKIIDDRLQLTQVWLTHAHFDHIAGAKLYSEFSQPPLPIGLHPDDLDLYRQGGGAAQFGIEMPAMPEPTLFFSDKQVLMVGQEPLEVRHTPGHSRGHVIFYAAQANAALVGDLIFYEGVGRTDLPGGSSTKLLKSIYTQVLTLPPETRLLPGHGEETSVEHEKEYNPFIR